jgi:hypothetical protein
VSADKPFSKRAGSFVIAAVFVVGAFFIGGLLGGTWNPFGSSPYTQVGTSVIDSVEALADLTTVEMVEYTTVEKGNDAGWLNWARGDKIFLFAVARIGAGIDFEQVETDAFEVDEATGKVTVRLPRAEIQFVEVDQDQTRVYDRDTGLFTGGDDQLESDARAVAEDVLVSAALEKGILALAEENARQTITEFLEGLGYTEIVFVAPSPSP